jgi:membrane associated rhomboid family serine protease
MSDIIPDLATEGAFYKKKLLISIIIPGVFVFLMVLIKIIEVLFEINLLRLGIHPLSADGISGIFLSPFIHADFRHLFNNTLPLFILSVAMFYFYSEVATKIFFLNYLFTGILVWLAGREAWHIGASGLVYGLASFLFFSGIIRNYYRLVALSLIVVFLYGGMVWGIFPGPDKNISWESHMLGFFAGIALSIWFRDEGPQKPVHEWLEDEDEMETGTVEKD